MRVLQQLAIDDGHRFPAAVPIIENSVYVDDTLFGKESFHELRETRDQLIGLMKGGGFQLRKANSPNLPDDIPISQHELADHFLAKNETLKILGLSWLPQEDVFCFVTFLPDVRYCRSSPSSTIHWDELSSSSRRSCSKNSGCSRTIGMPQSRKN
jgi:hypothetical protein